MFSSFFHITILLISLFALSILAKLAPEERGIPIPKDDKGFYFEANLGNKTHPNIGRLVPSFASDTSFFSQSCHGFKPYNCSDCELSPNGIDYDIPQIPHMSSAYYFISPSFETSTIFWNLNRRVWSPECNSQYVDYEQKRSGVIGMGFAFNFIPFKYPKSFSVLVNKEETKGALFYKDPPSSERTPLFTLKSKNTWMVNIVGGVLAGADKYRIFGGLFFDLNSKALGFDEYFYPRVFSVITKLMNCSDAKISLLKPKVPFAGNIKDLEPLKFDFNTEGKLWIPPEVYIESISEGMATLNIKVVSWRKEGVHYTNVDSDKHRIVLDSRFMSHYETVFDMSNRTKLAIKIYSLDGSLSVTDALEEPPKGDEKVPTKKEEEKIPSKNEEGKETLQKEEEKEIPKKENVEKECPDRSSCSSGNLFWGSFLAVLLSGVFFAYLRFKEKKRNKYEALEELHPHMY